MKNRNAFTLVELLVVIGIISVLAAMLLPTLAEALEQGRRVVCANNQKQMYLATAFYADESNGRLPYTQGGFGPSEFFSGSVYFVAANSSFRIFLNRYANVPIPVNQTTSTGAIADFHNIAYCPSRELVFDMANFARWNNTIAYSFPSFGVFPQAQGFGTTRLDAIAAGGKHYSTGARAPIALIADITNLQAGANNHRGAGGNIMDGTGVCRWTAPEGWKAGQYFVNTGTASIPQSFFVQKGYPGDSVTGALTVCYANDLLVYYGGSMTPYTWPHNRRMFGYR